MLIQALLILVNILVLAFVVFFLYMMRSSRHMPPYVPIPKEILPDIIRVLNLSNVSSLYDLGCGDGRVLFHAVSRYPDMKATGVDRNIFVFYLAKFRAWKAGLARKVFFRRGNFFDIPLETATHVFTYLYPQAMDDLLPKLEKELASGTRLVSADFYFSNKVPSVVIKIDGRGGQRGNILYVYGF